MQEKKQKKRHTAGRVSPTAILNTLDAHNWHKKNHVPEPIPCFQFPHKLTSEHTCERRDQTIRSQGRLVSHLFPIKGDWRTERGSADGLGVRGSSEGGGRSGGVRLVSVHQRLLGGGILWLTNQRLGVLRTAVVLVTGLTGGC